MIAFTSTLHLLIALSMAAPASADPTNCAADDPRCSARAYAALARHAVSNEQRVQYLYFAHRAYLASRDLCDAKKLIQEALALPPTSLRTRIVDSERETLARITEKSVQCEDTRRSKRGAARPAALAAAGSRATQPPALLPSTPAPGGVLPTHKSPEPANDAAVVVPSQAAPTAESLAQQTAGPLMVSREGTKADETAAPTAGSLAQQTSGPLTVTRVDTKADVSPRETWRWPGPDAAPPAPPPGRRLLIAGGVSMGTGLTLTGIAAYSGAQALGARRTGFSSSELAASPDNMDRDAGLRAEYERRGTVAIATGVTGGAAIVAAVVMLCVGARRKSRAADHDPILLPVRAGLLFITRF